MVSREPVPEVTDKQTELLSKEDLNNELKKFKQFAFQKSMVQISVGVVLGGAFNKVVGAISNNLIMPIINSVLLATGESWRAAVWHPTQSISIEIGSLLGSFVDFLLTAVILYILYVKIAKRLFYGEDNEPEEKKPANPVPIFTRR